MFLVPTGNSCLWGNPLSIYEWNKYDARQIIKAIFLGMSYGYNHNPFHSDHNPLIGMECGCGCY